MGYIFVELFVNPPHKKKNHGLLTRLLVILHNMSLNMKKLSWCQLDALPTTAFMVLEGTTHAIMEKNQGIEYLASMDYLVVVVVIFFV